MKNEDIRNEFEEFINNDRYKERFLSNEKTWRNNLEEVKEYIDRNGIRPPHNSKDEDIKLLIKWLSHQITNYNSKKQKGIMKNEDIRNEFEEFINDDIYKKKAFKNTKFT